MIHRRRVKPTGVRAGHPVGLVRPTGDDRHPSLLAPTGMRPIMIPRSGALIPWGDPAMRRR
jgi:hypothetical protein